MTDDDKQPNPWDTFAVPILALVITACGSFLMIVATITLARWLWGLP